MGKKRMNGEGTVGRAKSGKWIARLSIVAPDGSSKRKSFSGNTRKEAWDRLLKYRSEYQSGRVLKPSDEPLERYLERWLEDSARDNVKPATLVRYRAIVKKHLVPDLGHLKLSDVTAAHLQRLYRTKMDAGMAPGSVRQMHAVMSVALRQAKRWRLVAHNAAEDATPPKNVKRRESRTITAEDAARLFEAVQDYKGGRYHALFILAVATGMRQGEMLGLRWEDVDFTEGALTVQRTVQYLDGGWVYNTPKGGKSRRIKLPVAVTAALKEHRRRQLELRVMMPAWESPELVFAGPNGGVIRRPILHKDFQTLLERLGLPKMTFHELRHSAATLLLEAGNNIKATQKLLGHSTIRVTLDVYSHLSEKMEDETAQTMGDILFGE